MILRPYQEKAVEAAYAEFRAGHPSALLVLPTGAGKTPVLVQVSRDVVEVGDRVLILAHVKELLEQAVEKFHDADPFLPVGVYSAGLNSRDTQSPILVAGIQSVWCMAKDLGRRDLVIIDECHRIGEEETSRYQVLLGELMLHNPNMKVLGLTATPYRLDGGLIYGEGKLWDRIACEVGIRGLMDKGFLCRIKNKGGIEAALANLAGLKIVAGDFRKDDLAAVMDREELVEAMCADVLAKAKDRNSILIFAVNIAHAEHIWQCFCGLGEIVAMVSGTTGGPERDIMIAQFRGGEIRIMVNVMVLTEGFDAPGIDCIVLARPTASAGLYYQMVGRGFRVSPDKKDCLVLDYSGNIKRHGPVDQIQIVEKKAGGGGAAPMKTCPECAELVPISAGECPDCGFEFPPHQQGTNEAKPDQDSPLLSGPLIVTKKVSSVDYMVHAKKGAGMEAPLTLRVAYQFEFGQSVSEWICIEHPAGYARAKAVAWWSKRSKAPMPESVNEAVSIGYAGGLAEPETLTMEKIPGNKWPEIKGITLGPVPVAVSVDSVVDDSELPF